MIASHRFFVAAVLALGAIADVSAQAPLSREFERVFFARHEARIDRLYSAADAKLREACTPLLIEAMSHRRWADSLAGERCKRLARVAAKLSGFEPDDAAFYARFNFFLLALPEVVDSEKLESDRVRLGELMRSIYPLLKPIVVEDPKAASKDRDKVWLTARGVFGGDKPKLGDLGLGIRRVPAPGDAPREQGDSLTAKIRDAKDPEGWLLFDLVKGFSLANSGKRGPGAFDASLAVGLEAKEFRTKDPRHSARFWLRPGYHRDVWRFLDLSARVGGKESSIEPWQRARLRVLGNEILRPLLGREYTHRSWPVQALREGLEFATSLAEGKPVLVPPSGDQVLGLGEKVDDVVPMRVVWGPRSEKPARATLILTPTGHDENFCFEGLGIDPKKLQRRDEVVAVLPSAVRKNLLRDAMKLLRERFGVTAAKTRIVGVLDGGTRLVYGWHFLEKPVEELVLIAREVADERMFGKGGPARVRVIPAYGLPSARILAGMNIRLGKLELGKRLRVDEGRNRSLREAIELALRG